MLQIKRKKIAYCPDYAILFDSVEVAVFLSQFEYWLEKTGKIDDFIYKSQEQIYADTGLKPAKQKVVRRILLDNDVLFEKRKVVFQRKNSKNLLHYRIDFQRIEYLFANKEEVKMRYESQIRNTEKKNDTKKQKSKLQSCKEPELDSNFEIFWKKYDKNIGKSSSKIIWQKLTKEERQKAIHHADEFSKNTEKRYRPNPERYLSEKKFLDEIIFKNQNKKPLTSNQDEYRSNPMVGLHFKNRQ